MNENNFTQITLQSSSQNNMPYLSKYSYLSNKQVGWIFFHEKWGCPIIREVRVHSSQIKLIFTVYSLFHVLKKRCTIESFLVYLPIETKNLLQNHTRELLA